MGLGSEAYAEINTKKKGLGSEATENTDESLGYRLLYGGVKDAVDLAKNAWGFVNTEPLDVFKGMYNLARGGVETGLSKLNQTQFNESPNQALFRQTVSEPVTKLVQHPLDTVIDNPLDTVLTFVGGTRGASSLAEAANLGRTASALNYASKVPDKVITYPVKAGVRAIAETKLPEKLVASATRMPLSQKWLKELPLEDANIRQLAVKEMIKERIPPSEFGIQKVKNLKDAVGQEIGGLIDDLDKRGFIQDVDEMLNKGLAKAYKDAKPSERAYIKQWADEYKADFPDGQIKPSQMQTEKIKLQTESNYDAPDVQGKYKQLREKITQGMATQYRETLERIDGSGRLRNLNQTHLAREKLEEALRRTVGREEGNNLGGLDTKVLWGKNPVLAITNATIGHPQIKTRLAWALDSARSNPLYRPPWMPTVSAQELKALGSADPNGGSVVFDMSTTPLYEKMTPTGTDAFTGMGTPYYPTMTPQPALMSSNPVRDVFGIPSEYPPQANPLRQQWSGRVGNFQESNVPRGSSLFRESGSSMGSKNPLPTTQVNVEGDSLYQQAINNILKKRGRK